MKNKWELWLARVKFEYYDEIKVRPVIIFDNKVAYIVSFKVTTHDARKRINAEYVIVKWKETGLTKPSVVRLSR